MTSERAMAERAWQIVHEEELVEAKVHEVEPIIPGFLKPKITSEIKPSQKYSAVILFETYSYLLYEMIFLVLDYLSKLLYLIRDH
ncbi:hypothetical protein Avbf_00052 [Armadillidium vulgare]|nr:hypothetical protein Avbf_00052 [Armadillidium vulgare]